MPQPTGSTCAISASLSSIALTDRSESSPIKPNRGVARIPGPTREAGTIQTVEPEYAAVAIGFATTASAADPALAAGRGGIAFTPLTPCSAQQWPQPVPGNLVGRSLTDVLDDLPLCFYVVAATAPDGGDIYNGGNIINTSG